MALKMRHPSMRSIPCSPPFSAAANCVVSEDMEEDQHYERFDMDNDFEGFTTYGTEAFYSRKKKKTQQSEDDRLYGVFQGDSDSDDDGNRRRRRQRPRDNDDYARPVSFVSTGRAVEGSVAREPDKALLEESSTVPSATAGGLGFRPGQPASAELDQQDDEEDLLPTSFGKRYLRSASA